MSILIAVLALLPLASQVPETPKSTETEHFFLYWNPRQTSEETIGQARSQAEKAYSDLRDFLGSGKVPSGRFTILLEGDAIQADGSYRVPYVDRQGRVHLYRFGGDDASYFTSLPHELVHVFRRQIRNTPVWDPFLEEALASYVSDQVAPVNRGFPVYGRPLWLVAAQWLAREEAIPLQTLMQRHSQLNLPCKAQAYTLRGSFLAYLHQSYGKDSVFKLAYGGRPHNLSLYGDIFGQPFERLESEWKAHLLERYQAQPGVQQQALDYRSNTPVADFKICRPGVDF